MDLRQNLAAGQDLEYFQSQMKNIFATQAEHADRLALIEQRQDGENRIKSAWVAQSPFQSLLNGSSQPETPFNPAAEAFKNFDQDQTSSMMGSLHLDAEYEPRRGTSRANSVRFDESAIHGHFGHNSRLTNDFYPPRTGSALSSHPMTERSLSHKSEGRQSSAGHSVHSARPSSVGVDSRPLSATVPSFVPAPLPLGPPPGLFLLGPVPSIIRCWLNSIFTNESLLYAAVCTASYKSLVSSTLIEQLELQDHITKAPECAATIKLPVYLPEASVQQSSSRSASPAPQLPTITTDFHIFDTNSDEDRIHVFLGCDVLRLRNADIHFSLDRLTLYDDERNKVSVPLVRPEKVSLFQRLQTSNCDDTTGRHDTVALIDAASIRAAAAVTSDPVANGAAANARPISPHRPTTDSTRLSSTTSPAPSSPSSADETGMGTVRRKKTYHPPVLMRRRSAEMKDTEEQANDLASEANRPDLGNVWSSWRRDDNANGRGEGPGMNSSSGYQRAGRGRSMKVLKPARLNTSMTMSGRSSGIESAPLRVADSSRTVSSMQNSPRSGTIDDRPPGSTEVKAPASASLGSRSKTSNPSAGSAMAFGWLNPAAQARPEQ